MKNTDFIHHDLVTNSERSTFQRCPRLWKHKYIDLIDEEGFSQPLFEGSAFHEAMEILWEPKTTLQDMLYKSTSYIESNEHEIDPETLEIIESRVCAMVRAIWEKWKDKRNDYEQVYWQEQSCSELMVKASLDKRTILGKLDSLIKHKATGEYFIAEYKTSSDEIENPADMYWIALNMDNQIRQYKYIVEQLMDIKVNVLYIVAKKPKDNKLKMSINEKTGKPHKPAKRKAETPDEFEMRKASLLETLQDFDKRHVKEYTENYVDYAFERKIIIDEADLDNWYDGMNQVLDMMGSCVENNIFPQTVDKGTCRKFGRLCQFFTVCTGREKITDPQFGKRNVKHKELES
jgi:hypothetical protein